MQWCGAALQLADRQKSTLQVHSGYLAVRGVVWAQGVVEAKRQPPNLAELTAKAVGSFGSGGDLLGLPAHPWSTPYCLGAGAHMHVQSHASLSGPQMCAVCAWLIFVCCSEYGYGCAFVGHMWSRIGFTSQMQPEHFHTVTFSTLAVCLNQMQR